MPSTTSLFSALLAALVAIIAYFIGTSPSGVTPPFLPTDSPVLDLPPWPIFRPAVALNEMFVKLAELTTPPNVRVLNMATAYWKSEVLYALSYNQILDLLYETKGMTCDNVATQLQLQVHSVCQYMVAGNSLGLLQKHDDKYTLTEMGAWVSASHPKSLKDFTHMILEETTQAWRAAGTKGIKSGVDGFAEAYGEPWWEWHSKVPEKEAQFDRAMKSLTLSAMASILADWTPSGTTFCDVGGGIGVAGVMLLQHYPEMKAITFDQESVSERGKAYAESMGVQDRMENLGGSFFEAFPDAMKECDVFFMKHILHDWGDGANVEILSRIKAIAKPGAKVTIAEFGKEIGSEPSMETMRSLMSINMLAVNQQGARERTISEFETVVKAAGITSPIQLIRTRDIMSVFEADI